VLLSDAEEQPIGPFPASTDLFGDGSIRIVSLPGHAEGQIGAFVVGADGVCWFLAADACWSLTTISPNDQRQPSVHFHRIVAVDRKLQDETYMRLRELQRDFPDVVIIPSHCPAAAATLLPTQKWKLHI